MHVNYIPSFLDFRDHRQFGSMFLPKTLHRGRTWPDRNQGQRLDDNLLLERQEEISIHATYSFYRIFPIPTIPIFH
jgi:hypothetical protein